MPLQSVLVRQRLEMDVSESKPLPIDHTLGVKKSGPWRHRFLSILAIAGAVVVQPSLESELNSLGGAALPASICGAATIFFFALATVHMLIERR